MKVKTKLGNTTYTLEDEKHGDIVKLTRINSDGKKVIPFPRDLLEKFIMNRVKLRLYRAVDRIMEEV